MSYDEVGSIDRDSHPRHRSCRSENKYAFSPDRNRTSRFILHAIDQLEYGQRMLSLSNILISACPSSFLDHDDRLDTSHVFLGPTNQALLDGSTDNLASHLIRSSSFESLSRPLEDRSFVNDDERKRQAKLRNRACNDSFRQAVDKSYSQNNPHQGNACSPLI